MKLPSDRKVCMINFLMLLDISYWLCCFCIVSIGNKYFTDTVFFSQRFTYPNLRFSRGEKLRKFYEIFTKTVMGNWKFHGIFFLRTLIIFYVILLLSYLNPLSASPTKWSNTLKLFVGNCLCLSDYFVGLAFKELKIWSIATVTRK